MTGFTKSLKNKFLAVFIAVFVLCAGTITVFAATGVYNDVYAEEEELLTITVSQETADTGNVAEVNISLKNYSKLVACTIQVFYEEEIEFVVGKFNEEIEKLKFTNIVKGNNVVTLSFASGEDNIILGKGDVFATLSFKMSEKGEENLFCPITVECNKYDVLDENRNPINFEVVSGGVLFTNSVAGDVNGDGYFDIRDVLLLFYFHTNEEKYSAKIVTKDINGDGHFDMRDVLQLFQYQFGKSGVPKPHIPMVFKVTFDGNGGTLVSGEETQKVKENKSATAPVYEREGYEFIGFDKDFSCVTRRMTVTAQWKQIAPHEHTYSEEWSSDGAFHWHAATCEHTTEVSDKSEHEFNAENVCIVCNYQKPTTKLDTPEITKVEYDTVYWSPVSSNPDQEYTVRINDNYECTLKGTQCAIKDAVWNGSPISKHGIVSVRVKALSDNSVKYYDSDWSDTNDSYYYVPTIQNEEQKTLVKNSIGFGYNLIEDDYLNTPDCSTNSVFDVGKLLSIGKYTERSRGDGADRTYSYSSVDEFMSKTRISIDKTAEIGCDFLGSMKAQLSVDVGFDYSNYTYNNTIVHETNVTIADYLLTDFSYGYLKYCLSESFLKDLRKESDATENMTDSDLVAYLFDNYGTHAILGVTVGGTYFSQYVISTNKTDIAAQVKVGFGASAGVNIEGLLKANFGLDVSLDQQNEWKNSETYASLETNSYGGTHKSCTDPNKLQDSVNTWTSTVNSNPRSIKFTQDGAISLSYLLSSIDPDLGNAFEAYVDTMADEEYKALFEKYNKRTTLDPKPTVEEVEGKNVLVIDLSKYQKIGTIGNVTYPTLLNNVFSVYPIMCGKAIDEIKVKGAYDTQKTLINGFSLELAGEWGDSVKITLENAGIRAADERGFIILGDKNTYLKVDLNYVGDNEITGIDGANATTAISLESTDFTISSTNSSAKLVIRGGNGADGASAGANETKLVTYAGDRVNNKDGSDGAIAIIAKSLTINTFGTLEVYGGNGGDGKDGESGSNGYNASGKTEMGGNGGNGERGGDGGNAGDVINVTAITIKNSGKILLQGGDAGNGGNGGNGGCGGNGSDYGGRGGYAGNAGNGGNGGSGGSLIVDEIEFSNVVDYSTIRFVIGQSGAGGNGGTGGKGGTPGQNGGWFNYKGGIPANGGRGGDGGNGGMADISFKSILTDEQYEEIVDSDGYIGTAGLGGKGGQKSDKSGDPDGDDGTANDGEDGSNGAGGQATIIYNGHKYVLMSGKLTWAEAKAYAESLGGHLATITSAEEDSVLRYLIQKVGYHRVWLGAENTSGSWKWVTGEEFSYTNWVSGQPSGGDEHYLGYYMNEAKNWNDYKNDAAAMSGFIVEFEYVERHEVLNGYTNGKTEKILGNINGSPDIRQYELLSNERRVQLLELGYTRVKAKITIDIQEIDDCNQRVIILTTNKQYYDEWKGVDNNSKDWTTYTVEIEIQLENIDENLFLEIQSEGHVLKDFNLGAIHAEVYVEA